jgi:hypothetical protein
MRRRLLLILIAAVLERGRSGQAGFGVGWMVQVVPFQRSASVRAPLAEDPTATQTPGAGQDTPRNTLAWVGLGAAMVVVNGRAGGPCLSNLAFPETTFQENTLRVFSRL